MKFIVSSQSLVSQLQIIAKPIGIKSQIPILECLLFQLSNNQLSITGSDTEMSITTIIEVNQVKGEGKFAVPSRNLLEALKSLPEQPITFEINDTNLELLICYANGKYSFIAQNGDDYPIHKKQQIESHQLTLQSKELLVGISRTLFASGDDEIRPVMNGLFFDIKPKQIVLVASDGHKLVKFKKFGIVGEEKTASFILPKKPANLLKTILTREAGEVNISFNTNNAYFVLSHFTMICRLVEGNYPNYNAVIPQDNIYTVTINRLNFLYALKRVSIFSDQVNNLIQLQIFSNCILITSKNIDYTISAEESVICVYKGDKIVIGFKGSYLADMLSNIVSEEIIFKLSDSSRAGLILPAKNEKNEELLMLLMPMVLKK